MEPGKQPSLWPLAIIGLLFALFSSKRNQPSQSIHPQDTTEGKHEHIPAKDTLSHTNAIKPNSTKNESQNRDWVKISAIAQACAVPLGLGLLIVSICQSRATQTASDTAARQVADFEDTQRAILQVHPVWDNTTQRIVYNVRNIGQTIATEIDAENNGGATGPLKQPVPSFPPIDKMRASKQSIPLPNMGSLCVPENVLQSPNLVLFQSKRLRAGKLITLMCSTSDFGIFSGKKDTPMPAFGITGRAMREYPLD
jgi:F0F1-type ATP synthase membrane subunit c/vacuolar-type H+-ATPase subunit K